MSQTLQTILPLLRNHIQIEDADVVIVSVDDADEGAEVVMYVVLEDGSGVLDDDALARAITVSFS